MKDKIQELDIQASLNRQEAIKEFEQAVFKN